MVLEDIARANQQTERTITMANMTVERLHELFDEYPDKENLMWEGVCHDCQSSVIITASPQPDGIHVNGGSVFEPKTNKFFLKCNTCYEKEPALSNFQNCEVYSRVVGYLRPVTQWNDGKQAEFNDRKMFNTQPES